MIASEPTTPWTYWSNDIVPRSDIRASCNLCMANLCSYLLHDLVVY